MDVERRNDVLLRIAAGRAKEARITEVRSAIPSWADRPFKGDQEKYDAALNIYLTAEPIVRNVESRLSVTPGPIWKELTGEEQAALSNWERSIDSLYAYVNTYFPSESQKYIGQFALAAIAIGAFVAPLFMGNDDDAAPFPFHLEPFPLPPQIGPSRKPAAPAAAAVQTQRPSFMPSSFSRVPQGMKTPIPVQAEVMRPAVSTPPWRSAASTPVSSGALPSSPGFRSFAKPLGPSVPVTAATAQATATGAAPVSSSASRIYPRFRRQ